MSMIWTKRGSYRRVAYEDEADLEAAIVEVQAGLFGPSRIYLDVKKKIGAKGGLRNIPDGYLIDLSGRQPRLYVVENELASHDPLRHIAVQILQFSLSFEEEPRTVQTALFNALQAQPEAKAQCEDHVFKHMVQVPECMMRSILFTLGFGFRLSLEPVEQSRLDRSELFLE